MAAGIDGFIVSWKDTEVLSGRLELLIEAAQEEEFKLVIIYQGEVWAAWLTLGAIFLGVGLFLWSKRNL